MEQPNDATGVYLATVPVNANFFRNLNRHGHDGQRYFRSFPIWNGSLIGTARDTQAADQRRPMVPLRLVTVRVDTGKGCHTSERRRSRFALRT